MSFEKSFIDRVRESADIIDVVGRSVPLKKAGREFVACCPFHEEKSPSFTVSAQKQFYHCFGCGAHGNAITFLIEYHGLSFPEAVKQLALEAGIAIPIDKSLTAESVLRKAHDESLILVLAKARDIFRNNLRSYQHAVDYIKGRGVVRDTAVQFALGYADKDIAALFPDTPTALLVEAGLLATNDGGEVYDKFRRRVMFPIQNEQGDIVGFGGRTAADEKPKYLNSPESSVFHKGAELYGLNFAKTEIRKSRTAVVLEGYTDVIMMHQHGELRAVAGLGTSVTEIQIARLFRLAETILFCFDGDNAGFKASGRAARMVAQTMTDGKSAQFLTLPMNEDPDSFIRQHGLDGWLALVAKAAIPLSTKLTAMLISERDMSLPEVKAAVAIEASDLINSIKNAPIFRGALKAHFDTVLGFVLTCIPAALPSRARETPSAAALKVVRPARMVETIRQASLEDIGLAPGPDDDATYVRKQSVAPVPNKSANQFYKNFALYCALGGTDFDRFPSVLIDEFSSVITTWFAVAPTERASLDAAINSIQQTHLRVLIREAVTRMRERVNLLGTDELEKERVSLADAIFRDFDLAVRTKRAAALFD